MNKKTHSHKQLCPNDSIQTCPTTTTNSQTIFKDLPKTQDTTPAALGQVPFQSKGRGGHHREQTLSSDPAARQFDGLIGLSEVVGSSSLIGFF